MKKGIQVLLLMLIINSVYSQKFKGVYLYNDTTTNQYVKFTFLNQVWLRYTDYNSGTTIFNESVDKGFDIGLRRTRMQVYGNVYENTFFYMQMGINNFSTTGTRKPGIFFHDAIVEHRIINSKLSIGAGLTGWNGLSRYSAPSIGSILSIDAPLFAQTTNDISDQFLRKLSVYAKGQISKLDYRLIATTPMAVQQSGKKFDLSSTSTFSTDAPKLQTAGYAFWQFFEKESNEMPYTKGTYLGTKKVFNIGAGYQYQPGAMWHKNTSGDTIKTPLKNICVDVFLDLPLDSARKDAITIYASHFWLDYGPNYIQNIGAMNPANGNSNPAVINGGGTGVPVLGTGRIYYSQLGYLLSEKLTGKIRVQPYVAVTHANYNYLNEIMWMYDSGVNLLFNGHNNKVTFSYQNRPVFATNENFENVVKERKGMFLVQLQIGI